MTLDEFIAWDAQPRADDTQYELIDGQPMAMTEAGPAHGELIARLTVALGSRLRDACRLYNAALVRLPHRERRGYRPDLTIVCMPRGTGRERGALTDPVVVFEVLSPSTKDRDLGTKQQDYRWIPSLQQIVYIATDRRFALSLVRLPEGGWRLDDIEGEQAVVTLPTLGVELPLAEIYGDVVLEEETEPIE
jgi:Uma2 family endonuclease